MKFYKDCNKKTIKEITRSAAEKWLGKENLNKRIEEGKEIYREDPGVEISWTDGFKIEFDIN